LIMKIKLVDMVSGASEEITTGYKFRCPVERESTQRSMKPFHTTDTKNRRTPLTASTKELFPAKMIQRFILPFD
jgi:hypothetical protein